MQARYSHAPPPAEQAVGATTAAAMQTATTTSDGRRAEHVTEVLTARAVLRPLGAFGRHAVVERAGRAGWSSGRVGIKY